MGGSGWGLAPFMYGSGGWYFANAAERQKARTRLEKERERESKDAESHGDVSSRTSAYEY